MLLPRCVKITGKEFFVTVELIVKRFSDPVVDPPPKYSFVISLEPLKFDEIKDANGT